MFDGSLLLVVINIHILALMTSVLAYNPMLISFCYVSYYNTKQKQGVGLLWGETPREFEDFFLLLVHFLGSN